MLHLGGVGEYVSQIWGWSVHSRESGDLQPALGGWYFGWYFWYCSFWRELSFDDLSGTHCLHKYVGMLARFGILMFGSNFWDPHRKWNLDSVSESGYSCLIFF